MVFYKHDKHIQSWCFDESNINEHYDEINEHYDDNVHVSLLYVTSTTLTYLIYLIYLTYLTYLKKQFLSSSFNMVF